MGDGGVACMPLQQQQQHNSIMERFPMVDKTLCGGSSNNNSTTNNNNASSNNDNKINNAASNNDNNSNAKATTNNDNNSNAANTANKSNGKKNGLSSKTVKRIVKVKKVITVKKGEGQKSSGKQNNKAIENGGGVGDSVSVDKDKVKSVSVDKDKIKSEEVEEGELGTLKWENGEFVQPEKSQSQLQLQSQSQFQSLPQSQPRRSEIEKGEIVVSSSSWRRGKLKRENLCRGEAAEMKLRKESSFLIDGIKVKWLKMIMATVDLADMIISWNELLHQVEATCIDSDNGDRKYYGDYGDFGGSKSRRLADDNNTRPVHSEHYSRHSVERFYRNSSSSRISSLDKYSSRHHESSLSSRVVYDRHGRSPDHSERSRTREVGIMITGIGVQVAVKDLHFPGKDPHILGIDPLMLEIDLLMLGINPLMLGIDPLMLEKNPHIIGAGIMIIETEVLLKQSGPHRIELGSMIAGIGLPTMWSGPHLIGVGPLVLEKQVARVVLVRNATLRTIVVKRRRINWARGMVIESPHVDSAPPEELVSMEEDMDICDTPPHVPVVTESSIGKWFYLDYLGLECGPSKLCDLKALVEEGVLMSDHLIKHIDSDRWVAVENAVSPLVTVSFPSIASDSVTQLVNPPEAPGNLLADTGDTVQYSGEETQVTLPQPACPDHSAAASESLEDLHIDDRIGALLEGFTVIPGKEIETLGEILHTTFEPVEWQNHAGQIGKQEQYDKKADELSRDSDIKLIESTELRFEKDHDLASFDSDDWFSARWSCKGGDWKRTDEAAQERSSRKKLVLNDGFPLCLMSKSGYEDPRRPLKDDLYYPSHSLKLELPPWAFSCPDEKNDGNGISRVTQTKPTIVRGVKGAMRPVVRINACVVNDHGSVVSEPRSKVRGKERYSSRSARSYSSAGDGRRSLGETDSHSKTINDQDSQLFWKSRASVNTPKDRLCTADDLQLQLGEWYYLDGAGHERGPSSFSELQLLVDQGVIQKHISVFRKFDKVWVPVTSTAETFDTTARIQPENVNPTGDSSRSLTHLQGAARGESENNVNSNSFHSMHPQFIAYTRWKLHELVMKSYKREFAAAINEALDPWLSAKQPKKETEKLIYRISESDARAGKRARVLVDGSDEDEDMEEDVHTIQDESTFEELCGDAFFLGEESSSSETELGNWGLLDGHVLARVFHFLRSDMKSLTVASLSCKHWRAAVSFYKGISRQVDLSYMGPSCSDFIIKNITNGYNKEKLNSMVLVGCTNVTSAVLEEILHMFPCISSVDIRGCGQLVELAHKFPNLNWLKSQSSHGNKISNELNSKIRSLKHITEKFSSVSKSKGLGGDMDDFGELKDYFESVDKRDSANQAFRRSFYQRSKVFDARRSSSILSRDARVRRWAIKKSENGYKRMEEFLASTMKEIMKENTFDFFIPKVAEIEERMKNGYYIGHGLSSVKDDISRMCRDAIKAKNRGGAGDINHIVTLFIQLATRLEQGAKSSYYEREEMMKFWKDESPAASKFKKKLSKTVSERKYMNRSNCSSLANGDFDRAEYASDREIRKRLSKLNRKSLDSGTETSDDLDRSSADGKSDSESTVSDADSDFEFRSESRPGESRRDGYYTADEGLDSMTDEREWGARMTKAGLVPPVTRKYEVIDQYVIVADEEDVKRKMRVSLPEDYAEKLNAQKNGNEELDMELPEVKEYQPRKQLGDQVIEQEVYGIDPYTHNLLLDSMPEELDWSLLEKHLFIEDVLLRTLNKQVRHFTGTGNTPMMYSLQPAVEDIKRAAEEDCDIRAVKVCQGILKAIDNRPDDKYVSYRKGLGVVCNKERGFGKDDFVVEFLGEVYPVWKWLEKQDGIRSLQKNSKEPAPEFYNIYLERPKGDADGYDLVVVDAMHKANYASRICHSCRPNCEAKVTAVDGQYQIGIYSVREIQYGEEITFDYNSVTESKEEYEASVCLCGSQVCRGSYLNLTGEGAFEKVLKEWHGLLNRQHLMLEACELNSVSEEDYLDLGRAGLGSCLLGGLPNWVVAYSARLVRFINLERTKLPEEILRHNVEEKSKYFSDICVEVEKSDAEVQAEGVYNQRLQNLAITLDKVRYVMRCVFDDPKKAPPPLEKLSPEETVSFLWKGEDSLVDELLQCMAPHVDEDVLNDLKSKIQSRDPLDSDDIQKELQKSLLWLRDELRNLPCTYKCRNDAAADLIHIYAYTKCFFRIREYKTFTSPPVYISPLDLGPKTSDKLGAGSHEYRKTYGENYCLGQLIFWHIQTYTDPDCTLARASRGCLSLPDIGSFYTKIQKPSRHRVYGPRTLNFMLSRMEKQPQRPWPKDRIWSFKNSPKVFGSPMLDAVLNGCTTVDREMVYWLKHRPTIFHGGERFA
ncbi:hypothetical protein LWI28_018482 [Acer negundo]|uniref:SET domain-containing protein n=1 Tax=Acer negundo TaxID=4023 RepID=A0AAD5IW15_ACENE|nr:hypothetical protein LWI28_018482 [Acer negundo]